MTKFDEATQAIRVDENTYDVCLDPGYSIGGPLNGGYLMAVVLRAVVDDSPFEHPVSTTAQFLQGARPRSRPGARRAAQGRPDRRLHPRHARPGRRRADREPGHHGDAARRRTGLRRRPPGHRMPPAEQCVKLPDPKPESGMTLNAQMELAVRPAHDRLARRRAHRQTRGARLLPDGRAAGPRPVRAGAGHRRAAARGLLRRDARLGADRRPHLAPARAARPRAGSP